MYRVPTSQGTLLLLDGDLTEARVDAVVNAANPRLAGGGGVDGAIHRAAGHDKLAAACRAIVAERGPLAAGEAVLTPGFRLAARYIIHTVGPVWGGGGRGEPRALRRAYESCLALAREHALASLAFPAVSCGAYGYPVALAAPIALAVLAQGLNLGHLREARMVLRGAAALAEWTAAAEGLRVL